MTQERGDWYRRQISALQDTNAGLVQALAQIAEMEVFGDLLPHVKLREAVSIARKALGEEDTQVGGATP